MKCESACESTFAFYNSYQSEGPCIKFESVRKSTVAFYKHLPN